MLQLYIYYDSSLFCIVDYKYEFSFCHNLPSSSWRLQLVTLHNPRLQQYRAPGLHLFQHSRVLEQSDEVFFSGKDVGVSITYLRV